MAVPVAALAKIAAAALSDEDTRRKLGWIVAAICSPLILTLALICSLLSGSAEHNNSAVLLCFHGGSIPDKTPAEYVEYIEDMRRSFTLLDSAIDAVNDMTENSDSLDGIRVKAVFYAIFFGEDTPSRRAHRQFVDCFVTYEERTRTVTGEDGTETEESYTVAIPVADIAAVYGNLENVLHLEISAEQKSNADSIYSLVRYGIAGSTEGWIPGADVPFIAAVNWTPYSQSLVVTGFNGIHVCALCELFVTSSFARLFLCFVLVPNLFCKVEHCPAFWPACIECYVGDNRCDFFLRYPMILGIL